MMKTKSYLWIATIALLSSCSNEDEIFSNVDNGLVHATVEQSLDSRVGFEYENRTGKFFWSANDAIAVYHTGSGFKEYNLTSVAGGSTGDFKAKDEVISGVTSTCAVYPYNGNHSLENTTLKFHMSDSYTYANEDAEFGTIAGNPTNVPMLAKIATEGSTNFTFGHLGGALCFKFINVPAGANKFEFTANSKISGSFDVDITANDPKMTTTTTATDAEKKVTISFTGKEEATTRVFYIPVPTGTYTGFTWKFLKDTEVKKEYTTTTAVNTITDGKLLTITYTLNGTGNGSISSTVSNEEQLKNAVSEGGDIQLTANVTLGADLTSSNDVTIDLNGQTLTTGGHTITVAEGKSLTIQNTAVAARSTSTPTITGSGDIITAGKNSKITIGEGVALTTTGANSCCIFVPGSNSNNIADGVTINTAGTLTATTAGSAAIYVNGNVTSGTINVTGGSVTHEKDVAIYIAGKADLTISGGATIKGTTGVEVRAGSLTIEDAQIEATGTPLDAIPNGNGTTTTGAAIAISQHTTNKAITATIKNGTFKGVNALYEADLQANDQIATEITLSVTGGTFNGKVYSASCSAFIAGGTFSDASAFDYLADGANVTVGDDMEITKAITITKNATIDLNGKTIENKTAASTTGLDTAEDECIVFFVNGTDANLTINATNGGKVTATGDGTKSYYNVAVWAMNSANVTINGGEYTNTADPDKDGCDLIYGRNGAKIVITGGTFKAGAIRSTLGGGIYGVLNCKDKDDTKGIALSTITVSGGKYYEFGATEAGKVGNGEVILLGAGYQWSDKDSEGYYTVETAN